MSETKTLSEKTDPRIQAIRKLKKGPRKKAEPPFKKFSDTAVANPIDNTSYDPDAEYISEPIHTDSEPESEPEIPKTEPLDLPPEDSKKEPVKAPPPTELPKASVEKRPGAIALDSETVPVWLKEARLGNNPNLQGFTPTAQNDPNADEAETPQASYQNNEADLNALAVLIRDAGFPQDCISFLTDKENWIKFVAILGSMTAFVSLSTSASIIGKYKFMKAFGQEDLKKLKLASRIKEMAKKNKILTIVGSLLAVSGIAGTVYAGGKLISNLLTLPAGLFDSITKWLSSEETDCAPIVYTSLAATGAVIGLYLSSRLSGAAGRSSRKLVGGLLGKYGGDAYRLFIKKFANTAAKHAEENKKLMDKASKEVNATAAKDPVNRSILDGAPQQTREFLDNLPEYMMMPNMSIKELQKFSMSEAGANNSALQELVDKIIVDVYNKVEIDYKQISNQRKIEAFQLFARNERKYQKAHSTLRKQSDLFDNFDDVVDPSSIPMLSRLMQDAFDKDNLEEGYRLINQITETARSRGIFSGILRDKETLAKFALEAEKRALGQGLNVNSIQALNYLLDSVKTRSKEIRVSAEKFESLLGKTIKETEKQLTDQQVREQIKKRIEDIVFQANKNLPANNFDKKQAEEVVNKTVEIAEEVTKKSVKKANTRLVVETATLVAASIVIKGSQLLKFPEPTGAPWFFEDGSEFSFLNGLKGRETYKKLEEKVFKSPDAAKEYFNLVSAGSTVATEEMKSKTDSFIVNLAKTNKDDIPEDLESFVVKKIKEFSKLNREEIINNLEKKYGLKDLYKTDNMKVMSRKRNEMFIIITELFLLNSGLRQDLTKYFDDVMDKNPGRQLKTEQLKEIFNFSKNMDKSLSRFGAKKAVVSRHNSRHVTGTVSPKPQSGSQTESPGKRIAKIARKQLDKWPEDLDETDSDTWETIADYVRFGGGRSYPNADKDWVERNIANPGFQADPKTGKGGRKFAWSAVFVRWVARKAGHPLPGFGATHKSYTVPAITATENEIKNPGSLKKGEWFYLPMKTVTNKIKDKTLRDKGLMTPGALGYEPKPGDIILTYGRGDSGYHGDVLSSDDKGDKRIGGNVGDKVAVMTRPQKYGVITKNPEALKMLKEKLKQSQNIANQANEVKQMSKKDIRQLVAEVLNENTGMNYSDYPYQANGSSQTEPDQDYMIEWKALVDEVCGHKKKNFDGDPKTMEDAAVEVAKIFVKDSELFREVLELAGANKSLGAEIMQQLKNAKEKSLKNNLDSELDV